MTAKSEKTKLRVETKEGPICGYKETTNEGTYCKFKGIPYAKPPVGHLRFLPPLPATPWTNEKDCTQDPPMALTWSFKYEHIIGSEDCLYIEVSTPTLKPKKLMPVMFWIGSYGFSFNMDYLYDTSLINNQDVVFVTCGFRLGAFGFLSINDFTAPGNCGLKDVVLALKWVQRNVDTFGGDPNNVTIFGNSSGGVMVHFMMFSPMATGLFHKAIIQSACVLNNWSLANQPTQPVKELAKLLGINKTCYIEIIDELRLKPANEIVIACRKMDVEFCIVQDNNIIDAVFKPCIEVEFEGQPAFLSKRPIFLIKSGNYNKVPIIIGSNNIEGAVIQFVKDDFYDFEKYNKNVSLLVPKSLAGEDPQSKNIGNKLLKFYLGGDELLREDTRAQYLQLISDYYFLYHVNKTVRLHSQYSHEYPIYYYLLTYAGEWCVPESLNFFNSLGHCAEIPFVFGIKVPGKLNEAVCKGSRDSIKTRSRVVKMWTNFAKYGNPTPASDDPLLQITWDPVQSSEKLNYLSIGSELTKGRNPFLERMQFWDQLYENHTFLRAQVYFNDLGVSW